MPEFMTVIQVATMLQVSADTVRNWIKTAKLRKVKAGGRTLIERSEVEAFLIRSTSQAAPYVKEVA